MNARDVIAKALAQCDGTRMPEFEAANIYALLNKAGFVILPRSEVEVLARLREALPADICDAVISAGRAEFGAVPAQPDADHLADFASTLRRTREHFSMEGDQPLYGVYIEGTDIVICHTGTSPNSPTHARALTGAWNHLHDLARAALKEVSE